MIKIMGDGSRGLYLPDSVPLSSNDPRSACKTRSFTDRLLEGDATGYRGKVEDCGD
jgi:hypothetical protein